MCAPHVCDDDVLAPPTVRHTQLSDEWSDRKTSIGFLFFTTFPFTCRVFLCVWLVTASHTYSIISSWENCETAISVPGRRRLPVGRRVFNWRIYKERHYLFFGTAVFFPGWTPSSPIWHQTQCGKNTWIWMVMYTKRIFAFIRRDKRFFFLLVKGNT